MIQLLATTLKDELLERVRRNLASAIRELQTLPFSAARVHQNIVLLDGVATPIAHQLGRRPTFVRESIPRAYESGAPITGTGRIVEDRSGDNDRDKFVTLTATGFGATVVIDLVTL